MAWLLLCLIIFLNIGISSRKFVWGLYWQCASFVSFLCINNDCFTWITPPFPLKSFKCYFRSSLLILINTVLKLWKQTKILFFCIWVLHLYILCISLFRRRRVENRCWPTGYWKCIHSLFWQTLWKPCWAYSKLQWLTCGETLRRVSGMWVSLTRGFVVGRPNFTPAFWSFHDQTTRMA